MGKGRTLRSFIKRNADGVFPKEKAHIRTLRDEFFSFVCNYITFARYEARNDTWNGSPSDGEEIVEGRVLFAYRYEL